MTKMAIFTATMLALTGTSAFAHSRSKAELGCTATATRLVYDCTVRVTDMTSKAPIDGLTVAVKADMPSMAMAHNIPPVDAKPTGEPGVYAFSIKLDMFGNWAFSMRLSGPREDLIVEVLGFRAGEAQAGSRITDEKLEQSGCLDAHGDGGHAKSH